MRKILTALAASLLTLAVAASTIEVAEAAAPGYVVSGRLAQQFAPTHMVGKVNPSAAEAVALAKRVDVILAHRRSFVGNVPAMKQANPRLRILDYVNAAFAQANQGPPFYPESWYARDAQGNLVTSTKFGNYLMDISNSGWVSQVASTCATFVQEDVGYDGCFLDMLGTAPIRVAGYVSSQPINQATGRPWTDSEWINATTALAKSVADAHPDMVIGGNGLASGKPYFSTTAPTSRLWPAISGGEAEVFVRVSSNGVTSFRSEEEWKSDVDMLVDAGKRGEIVFALTKLWVSATPAQTKSWHKYALATFLLGTNGNSYFRFLTAQTWEALADDHPYQRVNVGGVVGAYAKIRGTGVYRRNFTKGIAVVNPTSSTYTVSLGGQYKDLDGVTRTSIKLPPHTGEVFVKAG